MKTFLETMESRRTFYAIDKNIKVSEAEIKSILEKIVLHVPSAFNSQTTRMILLLNKNHEKLWDITKETLRKIVKPEAFEATENKINGSFAAGYGTILFYEDTEIVEGLQAAFPSFASNFPIWSNQTNAMHQFATWNLLESLGLGASLQHYNPLIDAEVAKTFNINPKWKLYAEMPFGNPIAQPGEKEFKPLTDRFIVL